MTAIIFGKSIADSFITYLTYYLAKGGTEMKARALIYFLSSLFITSHSLASNSVAPTDSQILPPVKKILITYSYHHVRDTKWMVDRCKAIKEVIQTLRVVTETETRCLDTYAGEEKNVPEVSAALKQSDTYFWLNIIQQENGSDKLVILNLKKEDKSDVEKLSVDIQNKPESIISLQKLVSNFLLYDAHKKEIKKALLDKGIQESKIIKVDSQGNYIDLRNSQTVDFNTAYHIFIEENKRQFNFARAGIEIAAFFTWYTYKYYAPHINENENAVDWQFNAHTSFEGRYKTGEAYRFDDNQFSTNAKHIGAGTGYYVAARSNGASRLESLLFSIAASSAWEYLVEYREVVSINDQINTGIGGAIIGETLFQMSKLLRYHVRTGKANWFDKTLAHIFGGAEIFNTKFGRHHTEAFKNSGFDPQIWSKFDLSLTLQTLTGNMPGDKSNGSSHHKRFGIDAEIIDIPLYEQPGGVTSLLTDSVMSRFMVDGTMNDSFKKQFMLYTQTVLAAYYNKDLSLDKDGKLRGYNFFMGPSVSVNYQTAQTGAGVGYIDELAQANILGSTIDLVLYYKGLRLRTTIDVFGNFAMVRSYAFEHLKEVLDLSKVPSVLRQYDYYYAWGHTLQARSSLQYKNAELGGAWQKWQTDSINSRGRFYEKEDAHLNLSDKKQTFQVWITYKLNSHLKVRYEVQKINRSGGIENYGAFSGKEKNHLASIVYTIK